jgi:nucleoside-diphosphate-sugar epimerase
LTDAAPGTLALTGASGFIGASIAHHLSAQGWRLRLLVRPGSQARLPALEHAEPVVGTLHDREALKHLLNGAVALVHCAGAVRGITYRDFARTNVDGMQALLHAAGPELRVVHISSLAARHPALSDYAASKRAGELCVAAAVPAPQRVVLRPPAVYGPGDRELRPLLDAMLRGFALLPGHRDARFSLLHVDDLARAVAQLLRSEVGWGQIHEPDDGRPGGYGWSDMLAAFGRLRGRSVRSLHVPGIVLYTLGAGNESWSRLTNRAPMLTRGKARELRWLDWVAAGNASLAAASWQPMIDLDTGLRDAVAPFSSENAPV